MKIPSTMQQRGCIAMIVAVLGLAAAAGGWPTAVPIVDARQQGNLELENPGLRSQEVDVGSVKANSASEPSATRAVDQKGELGPSAFDNLAGRS